MEGLERKGGGSCLLCDFHIEIMTKFHPARFKALFMFVIIYIALCLKEKHFKAEYTVISTKAALHSVFHL